MDVHHKLDKMMTEWDIASGKCPTTSIYSSYFPDMAYLVHALLPEVYIFCAMPVHLV